MRLPRDIDGPKLVKALSVLGYEPTRQKGSHIRVTTLRSKKAMTGHLAVVLAGSPNQLLGGVRPQKAFTVEVD
jgi:predicted RNA binding protein YcfA (HicA-like mRNA interferase family)